jgi:hypothetical protein
MKRQADPLLIADVHTTVLIREGRTEMPERWKAITKGDCWAVPVEIWRLGSFEGLNTSQYTGIDHGYLDRGN